MSEFITKNVVLDETSMEIVNEVLIERGLGGKGFSAALRMIVREWKNFQVVSSTVAQEVGE